MANHAVKGTELQVLNNSTYERIGSLVSVAVGGGVTVGTRDVTHLGSSIKNFESTIQEGAEVTGVVIYDPGTTDKGSRILEEDAYSPTTVAGGFTYRVITGTTAKFWQFQAVTTQWEPQGGDVEGTWMANFGLKISRQITLPTTT